MPNVLQLLMPPKTHPLAADSWPQVLDDTDARIDWGWNPKYDLDGLVDTMVREIKQQKNIV